MIARYGILLLLGLLALSACRKKELTPREKLIGSWLISNVPDVQKYYSAEIKTAKMTFEEDGKLVTNIQNKAETGTWTVDDRGTLLHIKADSLPFNDPLPLKFEDERTIYITTNGIKLLFKKI
jgi:hypothetical protein